MSAEHFGLLIAILGGIQTVLSIWLKSTIEGTVKHQFDRDLEIFKGEIRQRERAALIAELIAEWDSRPADTKRLNQLVIEANLWLPEQYARDLNRILTKAPDAKFPKELILDIRHLLNGNDDGLTAEEIVHFEGRQHNKSLDARRDSSLLN
ncbi:MAG: hypothetical protein ACREA9_27995 [Pyrinomonadaceae bacterium]